MKKFFAFAISLLLFAVTVSAQNETRGLRTLEVGMKSITHVIFLNDLIYVNVSDLDVVYARVVEKSKNILALQAKGEFDFVMTLTALESNGSMHTFKVRYNSFPTELTIDTRQPFDAGGGSTVNTLERPDGSVHVIGNSDSASADGNPAPVVQENPSVPGSVNVSAPGSNFGKSDAPTLEEIMKKDRQIYHIGDKSYRIEAYCENIFTYSDLIYVVISLENGSDIGYESSEAGFMIQSKRSEKNHLNTNTKQVWPKNSYGTLSCPPKEKTYVTYSLPKITLLQDEVLKIYIYEKGGNRHLILNLTDKDINYAVSPVSK